MTILIKKLICQKYEYHLISKILKLENKGGLYIMTPRLLPLNKRILNHLWTNLTKLHKNASQLPNYERMIVLYQQDKQLFELFKILFTKMEYEANKSYVKEVFKLYVEFICTKVIFQDIKRLNLHKDYMALRDKFKYRHLKYLKDKN